MTVCCRQMSCKSLHDKVCRSGEIVKVLVFSLAKKKLDKHWTDWRPRQRNERIILVLVSAVALSVRHLKKKVIETKVTSRCKYVSWILSREYWMVYRGSDLPPPPPTPPFLVSKLDRQQQEDWEKETTFWCERGEEGGVGAKSTQQESLVLYKSHSLNSFMSFDLVQRPNSWM